MCDNSRECAAAEAQGFARQTEFDPGVSSPRPEAASPTAAALGGVEVRTATPDDLPGIHALLESTFETSAEADLVDTLHGDGQVVVSLVAVAGGRVVGHVLLSPAEVVSDVDRSTPALCLAPLAVHSIRQGRGIGTALVREALLQASDRGWPAVIVLGDPDYYHRFGFEPALPHDIRPPVAVPAEAWMVAELKSGALDELSGDVCLAEAFDDPALW